MLEGGLLHGGVQGSPVLRLFMRWVRRPLLPVMRLWRRNIQLKVVATTLLMSLGVVLLLGFVVIGQVRNGLLDAKVKASQSQATGGFTAAKQKAEEAASTNGDDSTPADGRPSQNVIQWMSELVKSLSSGGQSAFDVVTLPMGGESGSGRGPRASGSVDWAVSVPEGLRERIDGDTAAAQSYTRIVSTPTRRPSQDWSSASRSTTRTASRTSCTTSSRSPRRRSRSAWSGAPWRRPGSSSSCCWGPSPGSWCARSSRRCGWRRASPSGCPRGGCRNG
ncbi:hypothetical protein STENM36S_04618 [Streptomyces tendae]